MSDQVELTSDLSQTTFGWVVFCPPARLWGSSTALSPGKRTAILPWALWVTFPVIKEGMAVIEGASGGQQWGQSSLIFLNSKLSCSE